MNGEAFFSALRGRRKDIPPQRRKELHIQTFCLLFLIFKENMMQYNVKCTINHTVFLWEEESPVMPFIDVKILNAEGVVLAQRRSENEVNLVYLQEYQPGDHVLVEAQEVPGLYHMQLDDAKGSSLVYLTGPVRYEIPFGEKRINTSPKVFSGNRHLIHVRMALEEERQNYRNLSENVWDQHGEVCCYPHASANVETRGESVFAALNAIDGVTVSESHGKWPFESWGINRREDATWKLEFGRSVDVDKLVIYTRADFPHDNWWEKMTVMFSDGTSQTLDLTKGGQAQVFSIQKEGINWLEICDLVKADDPSPFPALTQLQVFGRG